MNIGDATALGQQALLAVATLSGPMLLAALLVGATISVLQAVTQVHEMTLVFVPKILAVFLVVLVMGGWMLDQAVHFGTAAFTSVASDESTAP